VLSLQTLRTSSTLNLCAEMNDIDAPSPYLEAAPISRYIRVISNSEMTHIATSDLSPTITLLPLFPQC